MNIKEIAKLAEVSVSTVSKIINGKDGNISQSTRERVMKVVKECNYSPYAGVKQSNEKRTFLIGILLWNTKNHQEFGFSLVEKAREKGYTAILCQSKDPEEELRNIQALCSYRIDGVIWDKVEGSLPESAEKLANKKIPCRMADFFAHCTEQNACIDYEKIGYAATQQLATKGHNQILCLAEDNGYLQQKIFAGFQRYMLEKGSIATELCILNPENEDFPSKLLFDHTGAICFSKETAAHLYIYMERKNRRIPKELSIICIGEGVSSFFQPELSTVSLPYKELAQYLSYRLVADMEQKRAVETPFLTKCRIIVGASIELPLHMRKKKIVVVGPINMDTLISLHSHPKLGETALAQNIMEIPGGKGLNQALGVARLGAQPYLIGKVGKDYHGSELFDFLKSNEILADGVSHTTKIFTGHAYIHTQNDGESGIVVYEGANGILSSKDISSNLAAFENAEFCLLQTEIDMEAVEYAARAAWSRGVKILLKPAAIDYIGDELLKKVFIFMPNEKEMDRLCPQLKTPQEKAGYFLKKGVHHVIITLGNKGCFWMGDGQSKFFPAAKFRAVDTTGAADAFAAALSVSLLDGAEMDFAIVRAICAAGFSTTKWGVPPGLIDKASLELYMSSQELN